MGDFTTALRATDFEVKMKIDPKKLGISRLPLTSSALLAQTHVRIDRWVDINSEECADLDPDMELTHRILKIGVEAGVMGVDGQGRIWGRGPNAEKYYPLHFEWGKKLIGYRFASTADN